MPTTVEAHWNEDDWIPAKGASLPAAGSLHLWRIDTTPAPEADTLAACVAADERRRAARFRLEPQRRRYLITQATLRRILGGYLDLHPGDIPFVRGSQGKPGLPPSFPALRFNLTTTDDLAFLAVASGQEIGIDCERVRPRRHLDAIADKMFSAADRATVVEARGEDERTDRFHRLWTRLEAQVKATGDGLYVNRRQSIASARHTITFVPAPGFVATVASARPLPPPVGWRLFRWCGALAWPPRDRPGAPEDPCSPQEQVF